MTLYEEMNKRETEREREGVVFQSDMREKSLRQKYGMVVISLVILSLLIANEEIKMSFLIIKLKFNDKVILILKPRHQLIIKPNYQPTM